MRWVLASLAMCVGCGQAPSQDQCKKLLDHIVDLEVTKATATSGEKALGDLAKVKASVGDASSSAFMEQCTSKVSSSRVECAMAATSVECPDGKSDCGSLADCDAK